MDVIDFEWARCIDGYGLTEDGSDIQARSERFEEYRPTKIPVLFQIFVDMPASSKGALEFVNKFGALGGSLSIYCLNEPTNSFLERQQALRQATELAQTGNWIDLVDCYNARQSSQIGSGRLRSQLRHQPRGSVALVFVPTNLTQFLWLQFALHLASDAKLLRCERCSAPFRVGAGTGRRETAKFCSNACKVAAFRARNEGHSIHA